MAVSLSKECASSKTRELRQRSLNNLRRTLALLAETEFFQTTVERGA
jgi:hypothetical protein